MRFLTSSCSALAAFAVSLSLSSASVRAATTIQWASLSANDLAALQPSDVATATAADLASLQPPTCQGWSSTLLNAAASTAPLTQCSGFTSDCINYIPPNAVSGFNAACFSSLTDACSQFNNQQSNLFSQCQVMTSQCSAALTDSAMNGLAPSCTEFLPPIAISSWTSAQLSNLPPESFGAIGPAGIAALKGAVCQGITDQQAAAFGTGVNATDACSGLVQSCVSSFTILAVPQLSPSCVSLIPATSLSGLSLTKQQQLSDAAIGAVTGEQLVQLYLANPGTAFLENWSLEQSNSISKSSMIVWNAAIDAGSITAAGQTVWTSSTQWEQQSQLQLSACDANCMAALFGSDPSFPDRLPTVSWNGMRASLVQAVGPSVSAGAAMSKQSKLEFLTRSITASPTYGNISSLTSLPSWSSWPLLSTLALSPAQVSVLSFEELIALGAPGGLSAEGVRGLTKEEIGAFSEERWAGIPCTTYDGLTADQLNALAQAYPSTASALSTRCYTVLSSSSSSSTGGSTNTTGSPSSSMSTGDKIGVALGCVLGVVCFLGGLVWLHRFHARHTPGESHSLGTAIFSSEETPAQTQQAYVAAASEADGEEAQRGAMNSSPYVQLRGLAGEERKERH